MATQRKRPIGGNAKRSRRLDAQIPMAAQAEAETVSINAQPAGSGSESRHLACEHHQTVVGREFEFVS